ncbi:MAG: ExbD/TolR family protein [Planctomycetota bacterium]|jgi:biopolymer transport protein ExbD
MPGLPRPRLARPEEEPEEFGFQLAPLVDIVFLLLVFFLVATTYLDEEKDLAVKLPSASNAAGGPGARLERVLVNVREDGTIILEKRPVSREELYRALVEARRANPNVPVVLRGDLAATHGEIVGVLDLCRRARVRVAVAVTPRREGDSGGN